MQDIIVATGNAEKVREIGEILSGIELSLSSLKDHFNPVPDIEENGTTFEANARIKAAWVYERKQTWALADDSGLEVDALSGAPGVYSARYAGEPADHAANNLKLLEALRSIPYEKRTARFRCVIAMQTGPSSVLITQGCCEGHIIETQRGAQGFGYDPLFVPDGYTQTFAELNSLIKNQLSHRGKALRELKGMLNDSRIALS